MPLTLAWAVTCALMSHLIFHSVVRVQQFLGGDKQMENDKQAISRRNFLRTSGLVAGAATTTVAAPWVRKAEAAETISWKVQTSWPAGVGLETFQKWCATIKDKTGGQLEFQPFKAKDIVGDFELFDGV